ncbi:hypothetical protein PB2503_07227 [Parvularcula bermudensis HTCC2503]|uniref:Small-conductance mechanosensitive channel n=1 Tax=Parvularcula bermudensis (strain ATCC BAA-594 / HTCC2503 / KCTC 12087) TaxID=314260 RepID=E0TET9_PARBH|nr:mechanosensitive ion channel domain-containing protein [Parvularcula bermudensis]ADM09511.1 hypothetical protein PB2503_07227 [Parvularcula bermudensis HTCC2503]
MRSLILIAAVLLSGLGPLALAQGSASSSADLSGDAAPIENAPPSEAPPSTEAQVTFTEGAIDAAANGIDDADIERRLKSIFAALPAFRAVEVRVADGVVRIEGTVPGRDQVVEAEQVASRVAGVVAVENALAADLSVDGRLAPAAERARLLAENTIALLPLLAVATGVIGFFWILGLFLGRQGWLWRRFADNPLIVGLARTVVPIVFILMGIVIALNLLDAVAVLSAVLGAAGVLGLAVGFAVRDTIENFIASVMLSLRQPFRPKDFVDIGGHNGTVVSLTSRATILMTPDGNHLRIPNAEVFKAVITNFSRNPERRITFELGIDAEDNPGAAMEAGLNALRGQAFVLKDPAPMAWIVEVGDSNIVLTFAPWIDQTETDYFKAKSAAITVTKDRLEGDGFTLPEPIYRLKLDTPFAVPPGGMGQSRPTPPPEKRVPSARAPQPVDTSVDDTIARKVDEDRRATKQKDLLSDQAPTEFGDEGAPA